jgi:acetyl esterase/lipase
MSILRCAFLLLLLIPVAGWTRTLDAADQDPREAPQIEWIELWPDGAPGAKGTSAKHRPAFSVHRPDPARANGAGVAIFPGGGYHIHAIDHEGLQVANWLNSFGVTAFLVRYRLKPAGYDIPDAIADGKRAMRVLRSRADEYGVDPDRLGALGFSAGSHLSGCLGIDFDAGRPDADDPVERVGCRPAFLILAYGGASRLGNEFRNPPSDAKTFGKETPPAFLFTSSQDNGLDWHLASYQAMRQAGTDVELHVFGGYGPHGTGLAPGEPTLGQWPELARNWMRKKGLLTNQPRHAVSGQIAIDGVPLHRGWITFVPRDDENRPIVAAYIPHQNKGSYAIPTQEGLCAGEYRVIVHEVARDLLALPTMSDAWVYDRGLVVQVVPGENQFNFELKTK